MRAARWECVFVLCAIAACQVDARAVLTDASTSIQTAESTIDGQCRPILTRRCAATDCGHFCSDDVQVPEGHIINSFACTSSATSCEVTYTTCDPNTGADDPTPPPATFDCANDMCPAPVQPRTCLASDCNLDCDEDARRQVPAGWKVISETCSSSGQTACNDSITVCDPASGTTFPIGSGLSCPESCSSRPTQTQEPCSTTCGHSCAADAAAQMGPGERIVASGCLSAPSGNPAECWAVIETCDANGNVHDYSSRYDDPCCGDPCCGDPCCGDECCIDGTGCGYGFSGPRADGPRSHAAPLGGSPLGRPAVGTAPGGAPRGVPGVGQASLGVALGESSAGADRAGGLRSGIPRSGMRRGAGLPYREGPASSLRGPPVLP